MLDRASGQTTLELVISASAILVALTGAGWVIRAQWERARCAYITFEAAHARLVGRVRWDLSPATSVEEDATEVRGVGRCRQARERVVLRKLEAWDERD